MDQRKLWAIAYPGITWGGNMEVISTHRGSNSFFNSLVKEARHGGNPKNISLHRVTLQDALEQGFLWKLQQALPADAEQQGMDEAQYFDFVKAGAADDESFMQEYQCDPADDDAKFLDFAEPADASGGAISSAPALWMPDCPRAGAVGQPTMEPLVAPIRAALADAAAKGLSAGDVLALLPDLLAQMDTGLLADSLTRAAFTARLAGDADIANA
ncbi:hypothetical protein FQA39_LY19272 [Lamprigera yunnana]|nr:hypothetical protein FQA39_LY19272 [Lamprigera yunnana]